jgi:hypothetical protein
LELLSRALFTAAFAASVMTNLANHLPPLQGFLKNLRKVGAILSVTQNLFPINSEAYDMM